MVVESVDNAQEAKSPKRERYVVTTEVRDGNDSKLQSQALLSATKAALPDANVRVKRAKAGSPHVHSVRRTCHHLGFHHRNSHTHSCKLTTLKPQ